MIIIRLRNVLDAYEKRTGKAMSYAELAHLTGLSRATVEAIGSRPSYNTTLATIDKLCGALECDVADLLTYVGD